MADKLSKLGPLPETVEGFYNPQWVKVRCPKCDALVAHQGTACESWTDANYMIVRVLCPSCGLLITIRN